MRWIAHALMLLVASIPCGAQDAPDPPAPDPVLAPVQVPGQAPGPVPGRRSRVMMARPLPAGWSTTPTVMQSAVPGREPPMHAAHEGVLEIDWEEYHTDIVIGPGTGVLRPAYVLTSQRAGMLCVAYRATAFLDQHGILHIDARNALICGPQSAQWSPDSFAIYGTGVVNTMDDRNSCQHGGVYECIPLSDPTFLGLLHRAESVVNDGA